MIWITFFKKRSFKNACWWITNEVCSHSECRASHIVVCASHSPTISGKSRFLRHEQLIALGQQDKKRLLGALWQNNYPKLRADSFSFLVLFYLHITCVCPCYFTAFQKHCSPRSCTVYSQNKMQLEDFKVVFNHEVSYTSRHPAVARMSSTTIIMVYGKIPGV